MAPPERSDPVGPTPARDQRVELGLALLLRAGVLLAAILVLLGGLLHLAQHGGLRPDYRHFAGEPGEFQHPTQILALALHFSPQGLIQLGVLVLLATPVLRVAFSLVAFARERDRTYVGLTALVLLVLLLSLLGVLP
jgi:uncharacterized membrane protein